MKKIIKASEIIETLKDTDFQSYNEIKENTKLVKERFKRGGVRKGAGRPKRDNVLKFTKRLNEKEAEFIDYARLHGLDYDQLMKG